MRKFPIGTWDGTPKWFKKTQDLSSRTTGSAVFDFEGDGHAEVVYADELELRVFQGKSGDVLLSHCKTSGTLRECPVMVDPERTARRAVQRPRPRRRPGHRDLCRRDPCRLHPAQRRRRGGGHRPPGALYADLPQGPLALQTLATTAPLAPGQSPLLAFTAAKPAAGGSQPLSLYVVVDDEGQGQGRENECEEGNNRVDLGSVSCAAID